MMLLLTGNMCVFGMRIQDDIYQLPVLPFQLFGLYYELLQYRIFSL